MPYWKWEMKAVKRGKCYLLVILPQVFHIPWVADRSSVRVLDVVGPVMNDLADYVGVFLVWA